MKNKLPFAALSILSFALVGCAKSGASSSSVLTVQDMIGRTLSLTPGSYKKVVCIGAGALRLYSYVGDVSLLSGSRTSIMTP
jgi:ABC-type Fe3+-hydroxamate transport system substrate-binding protein